MDKHGALYGASTFGGKYEAGSIFKLSPPAAGKTAWTHTAIYYFNHSNGGAYPYTSLLLDAHGALYGTTSTAATACGTVFKLTPPASGRLSWTHTTLTSFETCTSGLPGGNLVADSNGALYGDTVTTSNDSNGTIYKLTPPKAGQTQWSRTTLISFMNGKPSYQVPPPALPLAIDAHGNLYGATSVDGRFDQGMVFMLKPPGNAETGWTKVALHSFAKSGDGMNPSGGLIMDRNGALYGTTERGGHNGKNGTVYKLTPPPSGQTSWIETLLYSFPGNDGAEPTAGLLKGANGVLYGTTVGGGVFDHGAVFALSPPDNPGADWKTTTLYSFTGEVDGSEPSGPLIADSAGALYGTTYRGGEFPDYGTAFKLSPPQSGGGPWTETVLHSFDLNGEDGYWPVDGLVAGVGGVLYGVTQSGGTSAGSGSIGSGNGAVFQLSPPAVGQTAWTESILYSFANGKDGAVPNGGLVSGTNGTLYGTTSQGPSGVEGAVFELIPPAADQSKWTEVTLLSFPAQYLGAGEGSPTGALLLDSSGALYGTTLKGHNNTLKGFGTVFELTPPIAGKGPWKETILHLFGTKPGDGKLPAASLVADATGALYGTTKKGGANDLGAVFKLTPPVAGGSAWTDTILHNFEQREDGTKPVSSLILGANSTLYGTTPINGRAGAGTVFQITQ